MLNHLYVDSRARSLALYPNTDRYSVKVELKGVVRLNLLEMYLQIHPSLLSANASHIDYEEEDTGLRYSAMVPPSQYTVKQLVKAVEAAMKRYGGQSYRIRNNGRTGLLAISAPGRFAILGNSGVNADDGLVNHLGFGYNDPVMSREQVAPFPVDTPITPFVDVYIAEVPAIATKVARYRTPNRTLFTGTPETYQCNIVARIPILTTSEPEQERVYYRAHELDMIDSKCIPTAMDKLTIGFLDQFGRPVQVGEHNITMLVETAARGTAVTRTLEGYEEPQLENEAPPARKPPNTLANAQVALLFVLCLMTFIQYFTTNR